MIQLELIRPNIKMSSNPTSKNLKTPGLYPKLAFCDERGPDELEPETPEKLECSKRYEIIPIIYGNFKVHSALLNYITIKIRNDKNLTTLGVVHKLCLQDRVGDGSKNVHFLSKFIP